MIAKLTKMVAFMLLGLTVVKAQDDDEPELPSTDPYWIALYGWGVDLAVCEAYFLHRSMEADYPDEHDLWIAREKEAFTHLATWRGGSEAVHLTRVGYEVWKLIVLPPAQWEKRYQRHDIECGNILTRLRPLREAWLEKSK